MTKPAKKIIYCQLGCGLSHFVVQLGWGPISSYCWVKGFKDLRFLRSLRLGESEMVNVFVRVKFDVRSRKEKRLREWNEVKCIVRGNVNENYEFVKCNIFASGLNL